MRILVLNGGSSTFKCWYGTLPSDTPHPEWEKKIEWSSQAGQPDLDPLLKSLDKPVDAIGHRIVHGGKAYRDSTRIIPDVRKAIAEQVEFAPSHNRLELEAIQSADRVFGPDMPQVAVFDTQFHATLEPAAYVYAGPYEWLEKGVRRYGFHGISHQYASRRAAQILNRKLEGLRIITCHLGNGASLAAIRDGRSIDTTMGFTPLEGLMMGTRSGSIDPGIIIYLVRHRGYDAADLDRILNQRSGLSGISGISGDMREILAAIQKGNERAKLAYGIYLHRLCQEIGAMLGSLGGLDVLVFTAGVGENCVPLRADVARQFAFLGLELDEAKNNNSPVDEDISTTTSKIRTLVIHAEEDWQIARECYKVLSNGH